MNSCPRNWEHAHRQHRLLLLVQNRYHYFAVAGAWSQRPASISNYSRRCPCSARQNLRLVVRTSKNQQVAIDLWRWTFCLLLLVRANAHRPRHHGSAGDATCCTATSQKGRLGSGDPSTYALILTPRSSSCSGFVPEKRGWIRFVLRSCYCSAA